MDDESLQRVEKQRIELENNIAKLKKALRHWQTLEIDYEALREEFLSLTENASLDNCLEAAKESGADLIDEKELRTLLTDDKGRQRRPSQVIDLLSKRVDYVARNISTLRKQLSDAEKKRNALLLVENPGFREDAALPLAEITEELDEEGKVLSSKVEHPGRGTSELSKVLQKAGVEVATDETNENSTAGIREVEDNQNDTSDPAHVRLPPVTNSNASNSNTNASTAPIEEPVEEIERNVLTKNNLLPINPNDSEEDAKLRQDMLRYGLDEVGAIVAELEVNNDEEEESEEEVDFDDDDSYDNDDEDEDEEEEESEDESGRTRRPVISDKYRQMMQETEKTLGITDMKNLGPSPDVPTGLRNQLDKPSAAEAARKAAIAREEAAKSSMKSMDDDDGATAKKRKHPIKKVAFAPSLDIARDTATEQPPSTQPILIENLPERPRMKPIGDSVIERTNIEEANPVSAPAPETKKVSKFKAARFKTPQTPMFPPPMDFPETKAQSTPEGPPGRTIADSLVEREGVESASLTAAPDSADFDEEMHKREVADEYYKIRNRKIHEQGGYVGDGELDNYGDEYTAPVIEDEVTGKRRKVSRFKAARMKSPDGRPSLN